MSESVLYIAGIHKTIHFQGAQFDEETFGCAMGKTFDF